MIEINRKLCDRCGCCVAVCEADCITVYESCIEIDDSKCLNCKKCVWICPLDALKMTENDNS